MQVAPAPVATEFQAVGQRPLMRLEIIVGGAPVNICTLPDPVTGVAKNYLKNISFSSGGARMTPNPIAGQFTAEISNEGNIFHPNHPTSPYAAYFRANREVRIWLGGNYTPGGIKYWQRITGYMDQPDFSSDTYELTITGLDYMKVLSDMEFTKIISIWEVNFDGGQNEPAVGDDVGTPTDDNFFITAYSLTSGSWVGGDAVGKLWLRKSGFTTCGWLDNEDITNNTQANTLAGGAGLGVNGAVIKTYTPIDNYWGSLHTTDSLLTSNLGPELYDPALPPGDAGATVASGKEGGNTAANWIGGPNPATINPAAGVISPWEIKIDADPAKKRSSSLYNGVCVFVAGKQYSVTFRYARTVGDAGGGRHLRFTLHSAATGNILGGTPGYLDPPINYPASGAYETCTFQTDIISALDAGNVNLILVIFNRGTALTPVPMTWRVDEISIKRADPPVIVYYNMPIVPVSCTGIYHVVLDGVEQWPGKQKGEGWYYDLGTNRFWFDIDKIVLAGNNNLEIYYFTEQNAEDVVADILVKARFYTTRALAITAMGGAGAVATSVSIPRVRFKAGSPYIDAIKMICERCNWRFYFDWAGIPVFISAPGFVASSFTFNHQLIKSPRIYQDRSEIWNKIVIEGEKIAELVGWEDNMPSELKGILSDATSINLNGENTKTIKNILFQNLGDIYSMLEILLVAYKDPKWYLDFETPYNAVPLELADTIQAQELLDIAGPITVMHTCLIRNVDVTRYNMIYKCQLPL